MEIEDLKDTKGPGVSRVTYGEAYLVEEVKKISGTCNKNGQW